MSDNSPINGKLDYIELPAADFGAVDKFYASVFDWEFTSYGDDYHAFTDGKLNGGFYKSEARSTYKDGAALVIIYAADLEAMQAKVIAAGGRIVEPVFSFPGGRRFHFADPHGNDLAVWSDQDAAN